MAFFLLNKTALLALLLADASPSSQAIWMGVTGLTYAGVKTTTMHYFRSKR